MSSLFLVRHGQASVEGDDYDVLSPLGGEQCRAMAIVWSRLGLSFDRVVIGPRRRHRQSYDAARQVFQDAGVSWPEPEFLDDLDEHHGPQVLDTHRQALLPEVEHPEDNGNFMKSYLRLFRLGMERWTTGQLETPEPFEDWRSFRLRAARGLDTLCTPTAAKHGQRTVAFTSGGFVSAALGAVLGLDDRQVLELSFGMRNASVSEVRFSEERGVSVTSVNVVTFDDPRLLTFV